MVYLSLGTSSQQLVLHMPSNNAKELSMVLHCVTAAKLQFANYEDASALRIEQTTIIKTFHRSFLAAGLK